MCIQNLKGTVPPDLFSFKKKTHVPLFDIDTLSKL